MKRKIFKFTVSMLVLAGSFYSCENDIDMSKIDFSNIENLYKQPLPVIQKCVEGSWKLQYSRSGYGTGMKIADTHGAYIHLKSNHITMDTYEITSDSPIRWKKIDGVMGGSTNGYLLEILNPVMPFGGTLIPVQITNDTLVIWDGLLDNYLNYYYYAKYKIQ